MNSVILIVVMFVLFGIIFFISYRCKDRAIRRIRKDCYVITADTIKNEKEIDGIIYTFSMYIQYGCGFWLIVTTVEMVKIILEVLWFCNY